MSSAGSSYGDQGLDARPPQPNRIHASGASGAAIIQVQDGTGQGGVGHGGAMTRNRGPERT
jgi:hypothetical protein